MKNEWNSSSDGAFREFVQEKQDHGRKACRRQKNLRYWPQMKKCVPGKGDRDKDDRITVNKVKA